MSARTTRVVVASFFLAVCLCSLKATFLAGPARYASPALAEKAKGHQEQKPIGGDCQSSVALVGAGLLLGGAVAASMRRNGRGGKTAVHYSTAVVQPAFSWVKAGVKSGSLAAGELRTVQLEGCDVCIGKTDSGKLFAVGDKAPPTGTSLSIGGEVAGDTVVDGQYGSSFNVFTGEVVEWCPTPPILGSIVGSFMGGRTNLPVLDVRVAFFGDDVEVLCDLNAKKSYESDYWRGVLDAQGKDDGTYY